MARKASGIDAHAVADALHSAAIHILRGVRKEDARSGLGPARLSALSVLTFGGAMRLTDLAAVEQVRPPTMTKIVGGLESAGLVRRLSDEADGRATRIEATARGTKLLHEGRKRRVEKLAAAVVSLDQEELEILDRAASLMGRLSAEL
jgi:DNA-binding MarR family transcriptional regulator